jgi:hypothetical protein
MRASTLIQNLRLVCLAKPVTSADKEPPPLDPTPPNRMVRFVTLGSIVSKEPSQVLLALSEPTATRRVTASSTSASLARLTLTETKSVKQNAFLARAARSLTSDQLPADV